MIFGYVPSRRLGKSLGVNNLPEKLCSYSCVYCQIGRTKNLTIERRAFYKPEEIRKAVENVLKEKVDYITFVPNGEPTLDINLGRSAEILKDLGKVAVISNSSLIWMEDVRHDLSFFDLVSLKLDTTNERLWRRINRPHRDLKLDKILEGMLEFSRNYSGTLITETMLLDGFEYDFENIANFLRELKPDRAYISIPIRPPAERWVKPANPYVVMKAYEVFSKYVKVDLLTDYEDLNFGFSGDAKRDLLSITSVHPLREEAVLEILKKDNADFSVVEELINEGKLEVREFGGKRFYVRRR
ncbi:radical SAM protein [Archaeoglobus profundus]|uniref:Radical SAM domain protein n=1 Tax=Archaeoglobus profundus (strain DSM 5631 / JCM 9629 / NBRC 100127 / Av18) TaxID=572546 RepID=D2RG19_ARCPA|nr:radical SAM protein [Archaeoglobus profundus]ADB57244.1 Radical SAM domain protein [Archaeoglobus profundus DSM 5631]